MPDNFKITDRMVAAMGVPIEPQTGFLEAVEDIDDIAGRANFTPAATTIQLIQDKVTRANPVKYSDTKSKLFPSAARLNEIRICLQKATPDVEHATRLGMSQEKYGNWKHSTRMNFELVNDNVHRTGAKAGYLVPLEKIHRVLVWAHDATDHGGRDATYEFLKQRYSVDNITKAFVTEWVAACPHEKHHKGRRQEPLVAPTPTNELPGVLSPPHTPLEEVPAVPVVETLVEDNFVEEDLVGSFVEWLVESSAAENLVEEAHADALGTSGHQGYVTPELSLNDKEMEELFDFGSASEEPSELTSLLAPVIEWNSLN